MKFAPVYGAFALACLIGTYALHRDGGRALYFKPMNHASDAIAEGPMSQPSIGAPNPVQQTAESSAFSNSSNDSADLNGADSAVVGGVGDAPQIQEAPVLQPHLPPPPR